MGFVLCQSLQLIDGVIDLQFRLQEKYASGRLNQPLNLGALFLPFAGYHRSDPNSRTIESKRSVIPLSFHTKLVRSKSR